MKRIAFYGGSFDPVHNAHMAIGRSLLDQFELDEFIFIPAFHAPHKLRKKPTSAYDRYAMLCLVTQNEQKMSVSKMELEMPERPYSVETLKRIRAERPGDQIFFVMGADSWRDITTWREWETVLSLSNHIVVTRPGADISFSHVTDDIRTRIADLRHPNEGEWQSKDRLEKQNIIYITNVVNMNVSATEIRRKVREADSSWQADLSVEVANYIEKYQIYS